MKEKNCSFLSAVPQFSVSDIVRTTEYYRDVLGFKLVDTNQPGATFACGVGTFLAVIFGLISAGSTRGTGEPSGVIVLARLLSL